MKYSSNEIEFVAPNTPNSLTIDIAFTNIQEEEIGLNLRDLIPIRIARTVTENTYLIAANKKTVIGAASIEVNFIDTNTKQPLISVIVERETDEIYVENKQDNIDSVKSVMKIWVSELANTIKSGHYQT